MSERAVPRATQASPLALAMRRFWRMRSARWGLAVLAGFLMVAVYAPFLAGDVAIVWWGEGGLSLPIFADLFNARSYPKPYHLLFNLLVVLLPVFAGCWWFLARRGWGAGRRLTVFLAVLAGSWILCQIPFVPTEQRWQAPWDERASSEHTYQRYRESVAAEDGAQPWAVFALIPHRYDANYYSLQEPFAVNPDTGRAFLLGTDDKGYDVLARMAFGARISLTIGLVAVGLSMVIGVIIGAMSGYFGGWVDIVLQRVVELMMTFPAFILLLLVIATLGRDIFVIMIVLGLTGWAGTARLVRGEFLREMGREYVLCGEALGLGRARIMFRHILPNTLTPLLISATFAFAGMVLVESSLAFIGLGDPNAPSWGALLDVGRRNIGYVWLIWVPGLVIFLLVSSLNLVGNALREALDPKGTR